MTDEEYEQKQKEKGKDEHILDYARALEEIDNAMEPYKDHRRALKQSYKENGWLSKEEMTLIAKAMRLLKADESIEDISDMFYKLKGRVR